MRGSIYIAVLLAMLAFGSIVVLATPSGPNMDIINTTRKDPDAATGILALAGNVTEVKLHVYTVTQNWQGYYGNVTGRILLADANNNSLYLWEVSNPEGEVYATRSNGINWTKGNVNCSNVSHVIYEDETILGINETYMDSVNQTFDFVSHPYLEVGTGVIVGNSCYSTYMYNSTEGRESDYFNEIFLYDYSGSNPIYAALLEDDHEGFDGLTHDFEMIVPERGRDNDVTTQYYFYVEIGAS